MVDPFCYMLDFYELFLYYHGHFLELFHKLGWFLIQYLTNTFFPERFKFSSISSFWCVFNYHYHHSSDIFIVYSLAVPSLHVKLGLSYMFRCNVGGLLHGKVLFLYKVWITINLFVFRVNNIKHVIDWQDAVVMKRQAKYWKSSGFVESTVVCKGKFFYMLCPIAF